MNYDVNKTIATLKYNETLLKPKLEVSIERLLNKYESIMTEHHVGNVDGLNELITRACQERCGFIVQREWNGYLVMVWKS